jgi:hypothetical protein
MSRGRAGWCGAVLILGLGPVSLAGPPSDSGAGPKVDFARQVAPLLTDRCVSCHNPARARGGLDLSSAKAARKGGDSGPAVVPGMPDESRLLDVIVSEDEGSRPEMPKTGDPLSAEQVALLREWVNSGATWPESVVLREKTRANRSWWSLQPLAAVEPPSPDGLPESWAANPIDRFVFAGMKERGLTPSSPADRRTLIRRVTYDLTGLPPTPEEVEAFERDQAPDAYERLIDRLLDSPRYGEHWGRHWLDVARFGESTGFERNLILDDAWPYRDYIIRSFNDDKPFDRLVLEQLAGDVIGKDDPDVEIGTVFLVDGPYDNVGNQDAVQQRQIRANTIDDMITVTGSAFLGLTVNCARCHDHKFDPIPQEDYYRLQSAFAGVVHGERAICTPEERRRHDELLKAAGDDKEKRKAVPALPKAWAGTFKQPDAPSYVMKGGDPEKKGPTVAPASLSVLEPVTAPYALPPDAPEAERRLALARWIVRDDNPLTPRVLANRVWLYHFGTGIVDTPSDFGALGGRPTHPELLDWLARRLKDHGWRLKPLHREILLSQAYRQSSSAREEAAKIDASARYLWRFPPRRLAAEEVRDTILQVAGKLDARMGGPGFRLYKYVNDNVSTYIPLDEVGPETYRRAVYHQNARAARVDVLSDFDCPDSAFSTPARIATTTPLQALTLLNHGFTRDMARALSERLQAEAGSEDPATRVRRAFALAYGRPPDPGEEEAAVALIRRRGLEPFCRAILNSSELIYVD